MASPSLPREGAWVGGLTADGFAVQCRSDQDSDLAVEVYHDAAFTRPVAGYSSTTASAVTGTHWRETVYITGLTAGRKYYWRVSLDNAVDAVTYGTEATYTAGSLKTLNTEVSTWRAAVLGCMPWHGMKTNRPAQMYSTVFARLLARDFDFHLHVDDLYYSDIQGDFPAAGPTAYAEGEFYDPATDADATTEAYRTNFMNTYSGLEHLGELAAAGEGFRTSAIGNKMAEFKAQVPGYFMWGDHDRCKNDCNDRAGATGDEATRWVTARDVGHECFMRLNETLVEQDTAWTAYSSDFHYFYVDVPPCRFIVLDTVTDNDALTDADNSSKSKLGATQLAWVKARIDDNRQKYLVIASGQMLDGNHGYNQVTSNWFDWTGYTYERDVLLDYVRSNGNPYRTVFMMGDTHEGAVFVDTGKDGNSAPIYAVLAGSVGWPPSLHGQVNGLKGGVSGRGLEYKSIYGSGSWATIIESRGGQLRVSLECLHQSTATLSEGEKPGVKWSRTFK